MREAIDYKKQPVTNQNLVLSQILETRSHIMTSNQGHNILSKSAQVFANHYLTNTFLFSEFR